MSMLLDKAYVEWMNEILKQHSSRKEFSSFLGSNEYARECFVWRSYMSLMTDQKLKDDIEKIVQSAFGESADETPFSQAVQEFQAHQRKQ
jgi:hypothetical protein